METPTPYKVFSEQELERLVRCPLMIPTGPSHAETCAKALASWILRQSFEEKIQGKVQDILHNIRGKVIDFWGGDRLEAGHLSRTAAFRLVTLVLDYEVIHLEQPYNLILGGYTIQGQYALLRKRKGELLPHVLVLHARAPEMKHEQALPPDVATLARYVHVATNTGHLNAQVLHYPIFKGKPWVNKTINIALAKRYLGDMLKVADIHPQYPVMGEHCASCETKLCLEVFRGPNDDSRN